MLKDTVQLPELNSITYISCNRVSITERGQLTACEHHHMTLHLPQESPLFLN